MTRVLVVDDDHDLADIVAWMLRRAGYDVDIAYDALSAMRIAADVDAVVLDYNLPGTNGIDLAELLKATTNRPQMPCVLATAETSPDVLASIAGRDNWWHVTKPFSSDDLTDVIQRALCATTKGEHNEQLET